MELSGSITLADMPVAGKGRVTAMALPGETNRRLMEMGLTRGATFQVVRYAPMGDPMEIRVRGYHLSLRKSEAAGITVQALPQ
jgi:Fe2+ transport system protein FeoA